MTLKIGFSLLAAAGLAIGGVGPTLAQSAPKKGGVLNFAVVSNPPSYDCHAELTFGTVHPVVPHYSLLLAIDAANFPKVKGDLAESWTASPDGMVYTFKLHKGVTFHDGSALTSADVKASYDRIIRPQQGVLSLRKAYYGDFGDIDTPDAHTIVFKMNAPVAGVLELLASPFNCIYSKARLEKGGGYPAKEIMGSGAYQFVEHVQGSHWTAKRFDGYFRKGLPYLDGYKAYFIKSSALIPGLMGGQFDAEFRFITPTERNTLVEKLSDKVVVHETPLLAGNTIVFNMARKPLDDVRIRQALSLAIDRWGGGEHLGKISQHRFPGGISRPGSASAIPVDDLVKVPGFGRDPEAARAEARRLLKEAGAENLEFKLLNRAGIDSYTTAGIYIIDQWKRVGVKVQHEQLESKLYLDNFLKGNYEVGIEFISDYLDDPTQNFSKFVSKKLAPGSYSSHEDGKVDELYGRQQRLLDPTERIKVVRELDTYLLRQAYIVPFLWNQRIVVMPKKVKGWNFTPTHYLSQDLIDIWLDQ